jgi:hypothetical protein
MSTLRKALTAVAVAIVFSSLPSPLAAQPKEAPAKIHASVLQQFSTLWSELTAWFAGEVVPPPPTGTGPRDGVTTDNGCGIDPWGRCS